MRMCGAVTACSQCLIPYWLQNNNLEGGLPDSIGTLRRLQHLNVAHNKLTKALPNALSECGELELLDLQVSIQ